MVIKVANQFKDCLAILIKVLGNEGESHPI
jgi:hypothetical protein